MKVAVDHYSLCWLLTKQDLTLRLLNWSICLAEYQLKFVYKSVLLCMAPDGSSRVAIDPSNEIFGLQVMVVMPLNSEELQAAEKYYADILHVMDSSVKQVLHKEAKMVKLFKLIDGIIDRKFLRNNSFNDLLVTPKALRIEINEMIHS